MFYVHCYVYRGNTKCDEMKSSCRQPMKTEEHEKKERKVFVMGTGDPRCEYSAFYGQGRGVGWLRWVSCAISSYCVSYCVAGKARVSLVRGRRCVRGVSEVHSGEVVYHAVMGQIPLCGVCNREILL